MPRGDRTGPDGFGPRTGRGLGFCNEYASPGYAKGPGRGMGRGYGRGCGRGFSRGPGRGYGRGQRFYDYAPAPFHDPYYNEPATPEDEKKYLEEEMQILKERIEEVKDRLGKVSEEK